MTCNASFYVSLCGPRPFLQGNNSGDGYFNGVAVGEDDFAYFAGELDGDFLLMKVDTNGNKVWEWTVR